MHPQFLVWCLTFGAQFKSIWTQLKQGVPGVSDSPVITDESGYQDLVGEGWFIPVHMRSGFLPMQFTYRN
ncbi:TPA: hypothetical protein ACQ8GG_004405 [Escherichia coli]